MNKFPEELMKRYWVKRVPDKIQFIFDSVFETNGINKELNNFNYKLPEPFGKYIVLSREQEYELFLKFNYAKYRASKVTCSSSRKWLTRAAYFKDVISYHNILFALSCASKIMFEADTEELESEALFSLNKAIDKFNFGMGCKFSTFAFTVIRNDILKEKSRRKSHKPLLDIFEKETYYDIQSEVGISDAYMDIEEMVHNNTGLTNREKLILTSLFGLDGSPVKYIWEVGKELGISKQRVHEIRNTVFRRIRERFEQATAEDAALSYSSPD